VKSRFLIDLRVGPRTLETTVALVTSVGVCCLRFLKYPLLLVDDYAPYRTAILQIFGQIKYRRRRRRHGRKCQPGLKPPPGLLVGIVRKVRDDSGNLVKVSRKAFAGTLRQIEARIRELSIGTWINTSYIERFNGTVRGQQARLTRRTQHGSRRSDLLQKGLHLWQDLYNWVRPHGSLQGCTPAMAVSLADHVWSVVEYVCHPVHVSDLQRDIWAEERNAVQESALDAHKRRKTLPTS
jgi:hypothetical protein